ncbi:MAG: hypothetical protein JXR30_04125, partial [Alphaproteobacteria bacterium]|nr:hypothetical protein [Alphaproteobacteria bacterium]
MIQSLTYLCFFVGLIGLNFLFLKDSKKPFHPILWTALTLFILGLAGSFYLSNIHAASILTILISSALGIYISIIRTGLLSTRGIRTGLSLSMIFASLAILDMPT